jgi:hypothetical protein
MSHFGGPCHCGCRGVPARRVVDEVRVPAEAPATPQTQIPAPSGPPEYILRARETYPRAYERWSEDEEAALRFFHGLGSSVDAIAAAHERQPTAIVSRLERLGLIETDN